MIKTKKRDNQKNRMQLKNSNEFDLSVTDGKGRVYEIQPKQFDDQKKEPVTFKIKSNFINENKQNFDENKYDLLIMAQSNQSEVAKNSHSNASTDLIPVEQSNVAIFNLSNSSNQKPGIPLIQQRKKSPVKIDEYFYKIYGHMVGFTDDDSFYFKTDKINQENSDYQTIKNSNLYKNKKY
jgi:hypothetical protein